MLISLTPARSFFSVVETLRPQTAGFVSRGVLGTGNKGLKSRPVRRGLKSRASDDMGVRLPQTGADQTQAPVRVERRTESRPVSLEQQILTAEAELLDLDKGVETVVADLARSEAKLTELHGIPTVQQGHDIVEEARQILAHNEKDIVAWTLKADRLEQKAQTLPSGLVADVRTGRIAGNPKGKPASDVASKPVTFPGRRVFLPTPIVERRHAGMIKNKMSVPSGGNVPSPSGLMNRLAQRPYSLRRPRPVIGVKVSEVVDQMGGKLSEQELQQKNREIHRQKKISNELAPAPKPSFAKEKTSR